MAKRHNKEGGNHLDQESKRQKTVEDIDGGLHPAVDGQSLDERRKWLPCQVSGAIGSVGLSGLSLHLHIFTVAAICTVH